MDTSIKINLPRLISSFCDLVQIDSVTNSEDIFGNKLMNFLKDDVSLIKMDDFGNLYARLDGETKDSYFLSAHLDTVEPGKNIKPKIVGDYIISDGTTILGADNKVAIACFLEFIKIINENKIKHKTIELVFTKSEEQGNYGAINFDYSLLNSSFGFCFDSSNPVGSIILSSPYYERFDLKIIGKEAHSSKPDTAINSLSVLQKLLSKWKLGKLDNQTILNIGIINGGFARNTIPGVINLNGEIRSYSEKNLLKHKAKLIKSLKEVTDKYNAKYEIEFVRENPGYKFNPLNKAIKNIANTIKNSDLKVDLIDSWGVSDANIFNTQGLAAVNLGDGSEYSHSVSERIKIAEMENIIKVLLTLFTL